MASTTTRSDPDIGANRWLERTCCTLNEGQWSSERPVIYNGADYKKNHNDANFAMLDAIQRNGNIKSITLKNMKLDLRGKSALTAVLSRNVDLRRVTFSNVSGSPDLLESSLTNSKDINCIILQKCKITSDLALVLNTMILSGSLNCLTLDKVDISDAEEVFKSISESGISSLTIRNIRANDKGFNYLFECLKGNTALNSLEVTSCGLGSDSAQPLAELVSRNQHITSLDVSQNDLDATSIETLTRHVLQHNTSMRKLVLSQNPIGDSGAKALADWLCDSNCTLQSLSIVDCEIWCSGCIAFGKALQQMRGLKSLVVDSEFEDYIGVILESMECNASLSKLSIQCMSDRDDPMWLQIEFYLKLNRAKRRILMEGDVPASLWPKVLNESSRDASVLFYMLTRKPELVWSCS